MKRLSINPSSKYFTCFTCTAIQYLSDIWNWCLGYLMHCLFKIMYNTLGVSVVFLSKLMTINLIDLIEWSNNKKVNNTTQNYYFQKVV